MIPSLFTDFKELCKLTALAGGKVERLNSIFYVALCFAKISQTFVEN
jgi:hypothetical protein